MSFRGSDESLDREIAAVERTVTLRVRRATEDLRDLERELRQLRRERQRRRPPAIPIDAGSTPAPVAA